MRIILNGQQAFGKAALEKILAAGKDEIVGVFTAPDKDSRPPDPVKQAALEHNLALFQPSSYKDEATLETMRGLDADLMVMAYVIIFIPEAARDIPKQGSICFHPSLLPLHRGPSSINWPIMWGASKTGFTWFYPTDGLDEGDVLLNWQCEIGPDDTVIDLYFKKIYPAAIESVPEVCNLFRSGNPPHIEQDESQATYERRCTKKHAAIDWNKPVGQVYDLIRGTNPAPGAWTTHDGTELSVFDCARVDGDGVSSRVIEVSEDGVTVQCIGGRILVKRVRPAGGDKQPAAAWAAESGLEAGDTLGS